MTSVVTVMQSYRSLNTLKQDTKKIVDFLSEHILLNIQYDCCLQILVHDFYSFAEFNVLGKK